MTGLLFEGGARRGIFSAGVADCFLGSGVRFDYVAGVSIGAVVALDFVAGQHGRSRNLILPAKSLRAADKSLRGLLYCDIKSIVADYREGDYPFDFDAFFKSETECEIVITNCESGKAEYVSEKSDKKRLLDSLLASCSVPMLYPMVELDGNHYLDGSISDAIPFERAFEKGADKIVVVLTKPETEHATDFRRYEMYITKKYRDYPNLVKLMLNRYGLYYERYNELMKLEKEGRAVIIRPAQTYVKAFELNTDKLEYAYAEGYRAAEKALKLHKLSD